MTPKEQELVQLAHWMNNPWIMAGLVALSVWALVWKGLALWKAAKNNDKVWYVILLAVNTMGILEIIYYFLLGKKKDRAA